MRILHTAATYAPSLDGVAEVVRNVSERLAQRGHEVHVATAAIGSASSLDELRKVRVHRFSAKGNLALGIKGDVENYRAFVRSGNWDILVNHCLQSWVTDALLGDLQSYPWPSILITHGLSGFNSPTFRDYYRRMPEHLARYSAWATVSHSGEEKFFAREHNLAEPQVITNGIDLEEWSHKPLGLRRKWKIGDATWVVNVSNHNPFKNHRMFFQFAKSFKEPTAHITLIGGTYPMAKWGLGCVGLRGGCFYDCWTRGLTSRFVDLKTGVSRLEVVSAIQEADLIVSTSQWEANSVVLLESMAAGTPWVSFDVGSASENAGGAVVRDIEQMIAVVRNLLRDPDRRKSLGATGRSQAVAKHDWDRIAVQYEQLYSRTLEQGIRLRCAS